jgi:SAM-dependent methyltransferase
MNSFTRPNYQDTDRQPLIKLVPATVQRILDVGCNAGGFGLGVKALRATEIWGIEPDQNAASIAATRLDHVITDFFSADNAVPNGYFDLVTFNDSLEHMSNPTEALELAKRKLRSGGRVHCCVPNMRHIESLEHLILEKDWHYADQGVRDRTHLRFFTQRSIVRLLEESGFRVIQTVGINDDWWAKEKVLRRILFRLFPESTKDMRHTQIVAIAEPT